mmetsp:Transcript_68122/g.175618  ORF Transcript_68122/g.175618 Transcript_68122/m.175618 type:complete len:228 (-) Transcript_68122:18-701(-)
MAVLDVVRVAAAVRALFLHLLERLGREVERAAGAAVPVIHPLIVHESIEVAVLLHHPRVVIERVLVTRVGEVVVFLHGGAVDRSGGSHLQRLRAHHDDGAQAPLAQLLRHLVELLVEVVGDSLVLRRQREGQEPASFRHVLLAVLCEERGPATLLVGRAHALQELAQLGVEGGLRPGHTGQVQGNQQRHLPQRLCRGARACLRRVDPVLQRIHQPHVVGEGGILRHA